MKEVRWIIQTNLIDEGRIIQEACNRLHVPYKEVEVVPFTKELPEFSTEDYFNIYYGSTNFITRLYENLRDPAGLFYDPQVFQVRNYIRQWGEHVLNKDCTMTALGNLLAVNSEAIGRPSREWFVRPNSDAKAFVGQVATMYNVKKLLHKVLSESNDLQIDSEIVLADPKDIGREWRGFIVNGRIIDVCQYKIDGKLRKSEEVPDEVVEFITQRCEEYQPDEAFVMDVGEVEGELQIIECGCINSAGIYHCDEDKLVKELTNHVQIRQSPDTIDKREKPQDSRITASKFYSQLEKLK